MFHPTRGGVRGGRDQFKWDDVKTDKDRFNYLGNSLMAPVKKPWDQGPEAGWYVKGSGDVGVGKGKTAGSAAAVKKETTKDDLIREEKEHIKAMEAEYMASVLTKGFGFNKAQNPVPIKVVSKSEQLPKRTEQSREFRDIDRKRSREHSRELYHHQGPDRNDRRRERSPSRDRSHRYRHDRERSPYHRERRERPSYR